MKKIIGKQFPEIISHHMKVRDKQCSRRLTEIGDETQRLRTSPAGLDPEIRDRERPQPSAHKRQPPRQETYGGEVEIVGVIDVVLLPDSTGGGGPLDADREGVEGG